MMSQYYDAVVVGAGMGGIYQLYRLLQLGLSVKVLDRADGPGGTWFWNRYPGAQSDTNSFLYRYSWDKEDLRTYPWAENYLDAADILAYLNHVVDRHDLRQHMLFNTEVISMRWNDEDNTWTLKTSSGVFTARYVVTAVGLLSEPNWPNIPGLDSFKGSLYHTARWPEQYDFSNKTVAVIGNGSTGVQLITKLGPMVGSLLCLQRHPQYTIPAGRKPVTKEERDRINETYEEIWAQARLTKNGGGVDDATRKTTDVSPEERERIFQELWDRGGGIAFMLGSFSDLVTDETANNMACDFLKKKIAQMVQDPEKRRKLTPKEMYARRPICDTGYYEQFNRENVDIVDILENPIAEVKSDGVLLADGTFHQLDALICATGFNAFDGAYRRMHIAGRGGMTLNEHWKNGPVTNMGVAASGFPNLFMILGPKSPLANVPPMLEAHVDFITSAIERVQGQQESASAAMESTHQGEEDWGALCDAIAGHVLFPKVDSYLNGSNVEGKKRSTLIFYGGLAMFSQKLQECIDQGFPSFELIRNR
jgi:cyclohexanone monooxygenase